MKSEIIFLKQAIRLAVAGICKGGGPFGAVLTKDDKIVTEAFNMVVLTKDPTAHAEMLAIRHAAKIFGTHDLSGCTIYSSCEPCPMCLGAIYWAGIKRIVFASGREDAVKAGFSDDLIYKELMLEPEKRKITFIRYSEAGGEEVFQKWGEYENRKPY